MAKKIRIIYLKPQNKSKLKNTYKTNNCQGQNIIESLQKKFVRRIS